VTRFTGERAPFRVGSWPARVPCSHILNGRRNPGRHPFRKGAAPLVLGGRVGDLEPVFVLTNCGALGNVKENWHVKLDGVAHRATAHSVAPSRTRSWVPSGRSKSGRRPSRTGSFIRRVLLDSRTPIAWPQAAVHLQSSRRSGTISGVVRPRPPSQVPRVTDLSACDPRSSDLRRVGRLDSSASAAQRVMSSDVRRHRTA
jgi:hypothetical protein